MILTKLEEVRLLELPPSNMINNTIILRNTRRSFPHRLNSKKQIKRLEDFYAKEERLFKRVIKLLVKDIDNIDKDSIHKELDLLYLTKPRLKELMPNIGDYIDIRCGWSMKLPLAIRDIKGYSYHNLTHHRFYRFRYSLEEWDRLETIAPDFT